MSASPRPSAGVRRCLNILLAAIGGAVALLAVGAQAAFAEPPYDVEPPEVELAPGNRLHCDVGSWSGGTPTFVFTWLRDGSAFESGPGDGVYELKSSDKGHLFTCIVRGSNSEGGEEEESWNAFPYGKVETERPGPPATLELSGNAKPGEAKVGEMLECKHGNWTGKPAPTFAYEWLREGLPIQAATATTYTVQAADEGWSVSCRVTATNAVGSAQKQSNSLKVPGVAPKNTTAPRVLGTPAVGQQLTCAPETWTGEPPPTFTYQWLRSGVAIAGATGATYTVETADRLHSLACTVTGKNGYGEAVAKSSNSVEVPGEKPVNVAPPKVSGVGAIGERLTCEPGTWTGVPSPSYQYQWLRSGTPISLATTSSYTVVSQDAGKFISCEVTATNTYGAASEGSKALSIAGAHTNSMPVNEESPTITGEPVAGRTLSCSEGKWYAEPAATYSYEWLREGASIAGATKSTYSVAAADRGLKLTCRVIARNTEGTGRADSEPVTVRGTAPTVGPPGIYGAPAPGETLTCAPGSVEGAPKPTFSYRWLRDGVVVVEGNSYVVQKSDRGHRLLCEITATNKEGSASAQSAEMAIQSIPPRFIGTAAISASGLLGPKAMLTCNSKWEGEPEPTITYVWLTDGGPIPGTNSRTYEVTKFDEGHLLTCEVIATNPGGQESTVSAPVKIPGSPPEIAEGEGNLPTVTGLTEQSKEVFVAEVGEPLTCDAGLWRGKPSPTITFQWLINGTDVPGATGETFVPEQEDLGSYVACAVTASNVEGTQEVWSENDPQVTLKTVKTLTVLSAPPFTQEPTAKAPTTAQILASIERQISAALKKARRSGMLKHGSYSFSFESLTGGKLEVLCYQPTTAKASSKVKRVLLARVRSTFGSVSKETQKLALTLAGRRYLKGNKHAKMTVKVDFIVTGGSTVAWSKSVVLSG